MLELIGQYIIQLIEATSYFGIFVLMALESALIPIPSEVTMPFSGFLASQGKLSFWLVVTVGTLANLAGSLAAYYLGYCLHESILLKLIRRYGKFILLSEEDYQKAEHWFVKYGDKIIFVSRLLPAVRTVISLPAGVFKMDIKKFTIYTVLGCLIWSTFLTYIGYILGENWAMLEGYFRKFEILVIAVLVFGVLIYVNKHFKFIKSGKT